MLYSTLNYQTTELYRERTLNDALKRFLVLKGLDADFERLFADEQVKREMATAVKATLDAQSLPEDTVSGYAATGTSAK